MGISDTVGDALTYVIWSDATKKILERSAVRSADPNRGGISNLRVKFHEDLIEEEEPEIVEPSNILDSPDLLTPPPKLKGTRTNKHNIRWHDAQEPPAEDISDFHDSNEVEPKQHSDFGPKITTDDLNRSHPFRRKKLEHVGNHIC